jgi:hypothetical protein
MAGTQRERKFTDAEAERFARLMAGFDTANASNEEAAIKGQMMRRMAAEKKIRVVDALELPEIREAIDAQLQPARAVQRVEEECVEEEWAEEEPPEDESPKDEWEGWPTWVLFVLAILKIVGVGIVFVGAFLLGCVAGVLEGLVEIVCGEKK